MQTNSFALLLRLLFCVVVLFVHPTCVYGQYRSFYESNAYVYNAADYGFDFHSIVSIFQQENGAIAIKSSVARTPPVYISNSRATSMHDWPPTLSGALCGIFQVDDYTYIISNSGILIKKGDQVRRVYQDGSRYWDAVQYQDDIYVIETTVNKASRLLKLSGEQLQVVRETQAGYRFARIDGNLYLDENIGRELAVYRFATNGLVPDYRIQLPLPAIGSLILIPADHRSRDDYAYLIEGDQHSSIYRYRHGHILKMPLLLPGTLTPHYGGGHHLFSTTLGGNKWLYRTDGDSGLAPVAQTSLGANVFSASYDHFSLSYYMGTGTDLVRLFPFIKRYPRLYHQANSQMTHALSQDEQGHIWVASYQGGTGGISVLERDTVKTIKSPPHQWLPGTYSNARGILFFAEGNKGGYWFGPDGEARQVVDSAAFYFAFRSSDQRVYLGSALQGLWSIDDVGIHTAGNKDFRKINKNGLDKMHILTINEDQFGNIWGASGTKMFVYHPGTEEVRVYDYEQQEIPVRGAWASFQDHRRTLWFGDTKGRLFYLETSSPELSASPKFLQIGHPLLEEHKPITFMQQWGGYLILGANDRILLFDLDSWYRDGSRKVRYLSHMEASLSKPTEQNTVLLDRRDSTLWFASSDMLYQWDVRQWLDRPVFRADPQVVLSINDSPDTSLLTRQRLVLKPRQNTFSLRVDYQTKDNLPRLLSTAFVRSGDRPKFDYPDYRHTAQQSNLSAGDYVFHVRIFQQDGTYDEYSYPLRVDTFLWQKAWFIAFGILIILGVLYYIFYQQNQVARKKKEIAQLNLITLSNQFKPHFILNVLNNIGAELRDNHRAEEVIGHLGESIDIMYDYSQSKRFFHAFGREWRLVENAIKTHRLMYIPNLELEIEGLEEIPPDFGLPLGIVQVPVENALLHGLRNLEHGIPMLHILMQDLGKTYRIEIRDNGIGISRSSQLKNKRSKGTGLLNLRKIIAVINEGSPGAIDFQVSAPGNSNGTHVSISISKSIDYGRFEL